MAQTISQSNPKALVRMATGRILDTGTVAAMTITLGFKPRWVRILNNSGLCTEEWIEGMADASGLKVVDSGSGTSDVIAITSNGITPLDYGFTLGLDTDILVSSEQLTWVALG